MQSKLTLSVEKELIDKAKTFAKMHNTSISRIVEDHLDQVVAKEQTELSNLSPITRSLMGIVTNVPNNKSYKEMIADTRIEKYKSSRK